MTACPSPIRSILAGCLAIGLGVFGTSRHACAADSSASTRAARLTYLEGTVTVNRAGNTSNLPAQINQPLLAGFQLATGDDGQAEIEFEDGSVARLTPNSSLSLDRLTTESGGVFDTGLSLLHGLAYLELRATPQYRFTLNAGGDVLTPVENTTVRVNFDEPPATFAVLDGTAHVERQSGPDTTVAGYQTDVRAGESLRADATDPARYFLTQEIAEESWDQWNADLDQTAAADAANRTGVRDNYAGAQGYGWSDLDANGTWYDVPDQGPVWQPQIAYDDAGFDPYGNGAWVSYPGAGYVFASGYSWGWTPYRCGNWNFYTGFGWGWAPGAGCGGMGWSFAGGGLPVNIGIGPNGYRPIRVPVGGPHPIKPILPVRAVIAPQHIASTTDPSGARPIAGYMANPIKPIGSGFVSQGEAAGSALQRDFPVDKATKAPVLGLASTRPAIIHTRSTAGQPAVTHSPYMGQSHPPGSSTQYSPQSPISRQAPSAPAPRYAPPPPPAPHPAPAPAAAPTPPRSPR
jgi:hypothetical protein